ncbi:hypothetical protein ACPWSR_10235 [Alloiococcus sp. CFN-8]|uniref:hypothetical protein n=1 Tax=Alloiococcus sp. CFN-8 TaxID=3416081 RepID=UPI003CEF943F
MQGINSENIIIILVIIFLFYLAIKFIKGILKLIILIILFFTLGLSLYNVFILKKPISYEVNRYKVDFVYFKEAAELNKEAGKAINSIKKEESIEEQILILEELYSKAASLEHSEEIKPIHNTYLKNLQRIISTARLYYNSQGSKEALQELTDNYDSLTLRFKDILFPKK